MNPVQKISVIFLFLASFQSAQAGWTRQNSGTFAWLHSIYFLNENKGWIVGSQGTFLTTEDNGKSWRQANKFTADTIRDVYFSDERSGWVLCERAAFDAGAVAPSYLMKTADGGASWERIEFAGDGRERIVRMFFTTSGYGYAVGESGAFFAMRDDRKTWKRTPTPSRYLLLDVNFTDDLHGAIVGGGRTILFTEDAGLTWNKAFVAGKSEAKLSSVFFINQKTGWAVGAQGKIYATMNAGRLWREQNSSVDKDLTDIYFANTAEGWSIGERGTLLHSTTGGNVWNAIESNVRHKLEKITFAGKKGFVVGFGGTLLIYDAAGSRDSRETTPRLQSRTQ